MPTESDEMARPPGALRLVQGLRYAASPGFHECGSFGPRDRALRTSNPGSIRISPMKLYYVPITRGFRVRWLLEEAGEPYELARISFRSGDHKRPEYLAIHPLGSVPALIDGDI